MDRILLHKINIEKHLWRIEGLRIEGFKRALILNRRSISC